MSKTKYIWLYSFAVGQPTSFLTYILLLAEKILDSKFSGVMTKCNENQETGEW